MQEFIDMLSAFRFLLILGGVGLFSLVAVGWLTEEDEADDE